MRQIARDVGISVAALYHHFPNKQSLYLTSMAHAFSPEVAGIRKAIESQGSDREKFRRLIVNFTKMIGADQNFRSLILREVLDGDRERLRLLATQVFLEPFQAVAQLAENIAPGMDPHLLSKSMIGMVLFHFETTAISKHLPGAKDNHESAEVIAQHVADILLGAT